MMALRRTGVPMQCPVHGGVLCVLSDMCEYIIIFYVIKRSDMFEDIQCAGIGLKNGKPCDHATPLRKAEKRENAFF